MQATIHTNYPIFEADQVLTSKHLNDLVGYLEEQERLTRNKLIGIGIACGLDVSMNESGTAIFVSPGVGVTSEGHLVTFKEEAQGSSVFYDFFRPFTFGERQPYPFFQKNGETIELFELFDVRVEEAEPFSELEGGVEEYVILLFLDCFDKKLKNCIGNDCNEKGTERSFTLRPLLVKKSDARDIICREEELNVPKTEEEIDLHVNARYRLPALEVPRFRLNNHELSHFNDLYVRYDSLIEPFIPSLQKTLQLTYERFRPLLKDLFETNPFQSNGSTDLKSKYAFVKKKSPFAVQYFYDMLRDLTNVYNEFRREVFDLMSECCPASGRFPKHLRLGHLTFGNECVKSPYRTQFIHAPIANDQGVLKQKVISLFKKMVLLPTKFKIPKTDQIRITPGRKASQKALIGTIPYYYNIEKEGELLKNWDAEKLKRCNYEENLSYHASRYAGATLQVRHPLQYDHEQHDFLHIEGHLGMEYRTALTRILAIRNQENLPFDVVALTMAENASGTTIDFSECHFRDLEIMCQAWRKELECVLGDVVKGVSRVDVNYTLKRTATFDRDVTSPVLTTATFNRPLLTNNAVLAGTLKAEIDVGESVKDSIEVKESTLGVLLNEAVRTAHVSGGDYYLYADAILKNNEEIKGLSQAEYEIAFAAPMLVAARAVAFAEKVTGTCDNLDMRVLEANREELIAEANRYMSLLTGFTATAESKIRINVLHMIRLMSVLIGRCTLEQLKIIKQEIENRKNQLRKMNLFSEYVSKNPGIEHQGGVPKGGTFIMVHHDVSQRDIATHDGPFLVRGRVLKQDDQPANEAAVFEKGDEQGTTTDPLGNFSLFVNKLPATLISKNEELGVLELEVNDATKTVVFKPGLDGQSEVFPAPKRFTVFADFNLPYLCCSDCPPIDYVILPPDGKVALELASRSFCVPVPDDFSGVLFSVYPARGLVSGTGVSGHVSSGFVFNPNDVDMGDLEEMEIKDFKVNEEEVPLIINLYKKPVAQFQAAVDPGEQNNEGMIATMTLTNESSENAVQFRWTIQRAFIAGKTIENHVVETEERTPLKIPVFVKRGEGVNVKLEVFTKHCEDSVEQVVEVIFKPREIELDILGPTGKQLDLRKKWPYGMPVSLIALPGGGKLIEGVSLVMAKPKLTLTTNAQNKYVFNTKRGLRTNPFSSRYTDITHTFTYTLPEGVTKNISIKVESDTRYIKPTITGGNVLTGGGTINPGGFVFGGRSVDAGGTVAGGNILTETLVTHQLVLENIRNDARFRTLLGPGSDAFKVTANLTKSFASITSGQDFSTKMLVAAKDVSKRLVDASKEKDRDYIFQLLQIQMEQLVGMVAFQQKDLPSTDPLSKLITQVKAQVKKLQDSGVRTDKRKVLSKSLIVMAKSIKGKPKSIKRVNELIAQIKK